MDLLTYALCKKYINNKVSEVVSLSPFEYKGSVDSYSNLPSNAQKGNIYSVTSTNESYLFDGSNWIKINSYITKEDLQANFDKIDKLEKEINNVKTSVIWEEVE